MSNFIEPFRALRPTHEHAADVIAPPYDVVSTEEARRIASGRPNDFLHISRPEIDFPAGVDPHSDAVYARGAASLAALQSAGILIRDASPSLYLYRLEMSGHLQTGVAMTASIDAYEAHRVRRHESTRPDKETDRVRNIESLNAQTGPVLCAYRQTDALDRLIAEAAGGDPLFSVAGPNDVMHTIWRVADSEPLANLLSALNALDALYIADGHHRSAAASRVAANRRRNGETSRSSDYFLTVAFPHDQMRILDYNRAVADLNGLSPADFLAALGARFGVEPVGEAHKPDKPRTFGMYLNGNWYRIVARDGASNDPVENLDVSILQRGIIEPILAITDPRTDPRIDFIGGVRGLAELEKRVSEGRAAAAFALYPTSMEQLMDVADAEELMPPKSTWFEPKLADGLLSHVLD